MVVTVGAWASRLRRAGWGVVDQAISSVTNAALAVVVARSVSVEAFGAFGLAFAWYSASVGLSRALTAEPLLVRYSDDTPSLRTHAGAAAGTAAAAGALSGVLAVAAAVALGGPTRQALVAVAIVLPGLLVQDVWRAVFIGSGTPRQAVVNDGIWAVAQGGLFAAVIVLDLGARLPMLIISWGAAAAVAAGAASAVTRTGPRLREVRHWVRAHVDLGGRFALEFAAITGSAHIALYAIAAVGGLIAVGALRAAQVLTGPLNIVFLAVPMIAVPEAVRLRASDPRRLPPSAIGLSAALSVGALVWGWVCLQLPASVGEAVLGDSWQEARAVLIPVTALLMSVGAEKGAIVVLRAYAAARSSLRVALVWGPLTIVGGLLGALTGGAYGAAAGMAVAHWVGTAVWWGHAARYLRGGPPQPSDRQHTVDVLDDGRSQPATKSK